MEETTIKTFEVYWLDPVEYDAEVETVMSGLAQDLCPECGSFLEIMQGHCRTCYNCGWSVCGI